MKLRLIRMIDGDGYTFGRIEDEENRQVCVTVERPWVDANKDGLGDTGKSRIPAGVYTCRRDMHGKSKPNPYEVWEVCDVPGRSEIHIHIGNRFTESMGCPLVGTGFGQHGTVTNSRVAFEKLMKLTKGLKEITLEVIDAPYPKCEEAA